MSDVGAASRIQDIGQIEPIGGLIRFVMKAYQLAETLVGPLNLAEMSLEGLARAMSSERPEDRLQTSKRQDRLTPIAFIV